MSPRVVSAADPWYSSHGSDFNYDFHVTLDESVAPIEYNFRTAQELTDMGQPYSPGPASRAASAYFSGTATPYCVPGQAMAQSPACCMGETFSST